MEMDFVMCAGANFKAKDSYRERDIKLALFINLFLKILQQANCK